MVRAETENKSCSIEISSLQKSAQEFKSRLNSLDNSQHVMADYCIFRIPSNILKENKAPYRPQCAIIGPLVLYEHLSKHEEDEKRRYLNSFLLRAEQRTSLEDFVELINKSQADIRGCYEKTYFRRYKHGKFRQDKPGSESNSWLLIEMILVDAGFILELFLRDYFKEWRVEKDLIFAKSGTIHDIKLDLMLLENQLPFFLLKQMYEGTFSGNPNFPSFLHLTCQFFSHYYNQNISIQDVLSGKDPHCAAYRSKLEQVKHFTDLVRTFQLPHKNEKKHLINEESQCWKWVIRAKQYFMHLISEKLKTNKPEENKDDGVQGEYLYSAVLLREAGVKFKLRSERCLFDIEFDQSSGELKMPPLKVDNSTEPFYGNLMVWEQCHYPKDTFICNYIFLVAYLVKSVEDVDLLVRRRIIVNQLGNPKAIVDLFDRLCKHIRVEENRYSDLFMELNKYNANRHHGWMAILKLHYFSTPWKGLATIAAIILLILTTIQTACTVFSCKA